MLLEIVSFLVGHSSPLARPETQEKLRPFFQHQGDQQDLQFFCDINASYLSLSSSCQTLSRTSQHSVLLFSFGKGLEQLLHKYKSAVVGLEKQIKATFRSSNDPSQVFPITKVKASLLNWKFLLSFLADFCANVIPDILSRNKPTISLLEHLFIVLQRNSGEQIIKESLETLSQQCMAALLSMISHATLFGRLPLTSNEDFFISSAFLQNNNWHQTEGLIKSRIPNFFPLSTVEQIITCSKVAVLFDKFPDQKPHTNRMDPFILQFAQLGDKIFPLKELSDLLEQIQSEFSHDLFSIFQDRLNHFQMIRDYFLLGKGDLFQRFIEDSWHLMRSEFGFKAQYQLNKIWQSVGLSLNEKHFEQFKYLLGSNFNQIELKISLESPMDRFFSHEHLATYNRIFQLLFRTKKLQFFFQKIWIDLKQKQILKIDWHTIWIIRSRMANFVESLQFYFQYGIIETSFVHFLEKARNSTNFQETLNLHDHFISEISKNLFLNIRGIQNALDEIFGLCWTFCTYITELCYNAQSPSPFQSPRWDILTKKILATEEQFKQEAETFFTILLQVKQHKDIPALVSLVVLWEFEQEKK